MKYEAPKAVDIIYMNAPHFRARNLGGPDSQWIQGLAQVPCEW